MTSPTLRRFRAKLLEMRPSCGRWARRGSCIRGLPEGKGRGNTQVVWGATLMLGGLGFILLLAGCSDLAPYEGSWAFTGEAVMTCDGQTSYAAVHETVVVTPSPSDLVGADLEARGTCTLFLAVEGDHAAFNPGQTCETSQGTIEVRDGGITDGGAFWLDGTVNGCEFAEAGELVRE